MADRKISDLTALTTPASGDYLPIVDISEASAANKNKRITIEELLRGAPDGTAAAPGIAFESDPNTGIYRPGADQVAISTNGTQRLIVGSDGNVLVGATGAATRLLTVNQTGTTGGEYGIRVSQASATSNAVELTIDSTNGVSKLFQKSTVPLVFGTNDTERLRITSTGQLSHIGAGSSGSPAVGFNGSAPSNSLVIDSSGRLLVGTSTNTGGSLLQVNDNRIRIATAKTPASATDTGSAGEICWDTSYIYVCTATNTWKRAALSTW